MRALFLIPKSDAPKLDGANYSKTLKEFIALCCQKEASKVKQALCVPCGRVGADLRVRSAQRLASCCGTSSCGTRRRPTASLSSFACVALAVCSLARSHRAATAVRRSVGWTSSATMRSSAFSASPRREPCPFPTSLRRPQHEEPKEEEDDEWLFTGARRAVRGPRRPHVCSETLRQGQNGAPASLVGALRLQSQRSGKADRVSTGLPCATCGR
jgi:hypothetical protein